MTVPCPSCPWRRDQDQTTIPNFDIDLARGLAKTVGDGDAFRKVMACHHSQPGREFGCVGYLYRYGWSNLNVRLLMATGSSIDMHAIEADCAPLDGQLHATYDEMMAKLESKER